MLAAKSPAPKHVRLPEDVAATARLELRALERMAEVLCEHLDQLIANFHETGRRASRESDLQMAAFAERRDSIRRFFASNTTEPTETRIARLEKLVDALNCSRSYFGSLARG